mmetsp:Transcript_10264/g.33978  ORF Transcript_10264/g.33978 Transcript_10264/m.33978 type:complete len:223 (+) Transcript_10264:624-1292(+)
MQTAAKRGDRFSRKGGTEYAAPRAADPYKATFKASDVPGKNSPNVRPRARLTAQAVAPPAHDSLPLATGSSGLLIRSISTSKSWFRPVMNTFINNAGIKATATDRAHCCVSTAPSESAASRCSAGTHSAVPMNVCGRVNRQSVSTWSPSVSDGAAADAAGGTRTLAASLRSVARKRFGATANPVQAWNTPSSTQTHIVALASQKERRSLRKLERASDGDGLE